MALKTIVELVDDIDGSTADATVRFSVEGVDYEIDLSNENINELHNDFAKWIAAARRVGGRARRGSEMPQMPNRTAQVREWAIANNYEVSARGRVPAEIFEAFDKAHS